MHGQSARWELPRKGPLSGVADTFLPCLSPRSPLAIFIESSSGLHRTVKKIPSNIKIMFVSCSSFASEPFKQGFDLSSKRNALAKGESHSQEILTRGLLPVCCCQCHRAGYHHPIRDLLALDWLPKETRRDEWTNPPKLPALRAYPRSNLSKISPRRIGRIPPPPPPPPCS